MGFSHWNWKLARIFRLCEDQFPYKMLIEFKLSVPSLGQLCLCRCFCISKSLSITEMRAQFSTLTNKRIICLKNFISCSNLYQRWKFVISWEQASISFGHSQLSKNWKIFWKLIRWWCWTGNDITKDIWKLEDILKNIQLMVCYQLRTGEHLFWPSTAILPRPIPSRDCTK